MHTICRQHYTATDNADAKPPTNIKHDPLNWATVCNTRFQVQLGLLMAIPAYPAY
jgi:hypothetical protein